MLWRALCPVKAPVGGSDPRGLSLRGKNPIARNEADCHCELAKQSLFSGLARAEQPRSPVSFALSLRACEAISLLTVCQPWTTEIARLFCIVIASLRSNLSFLPASPGQPRSPRCARNDSRRTLRSNLFFCVASPGQPRSPGSFVLSLRACEAISLLTVCQRKTTEIATFLAMTRYNRDCRAALAMTAEKPCEAISLLTVCQRKTSEIATFLAMTGCSLTKQSLFSVCQPWTTEIARLLCIVIASLRSNLSFLPASPGQPRSPRSSR